MDRRVTKATKATKGTPTKVDTADGENAETFTFAPAKTHVQTDADAETDVAEWALKEAEERTHKEALVTKLEAHLAAVKVDAAKLKAASEATWPESKRWMLGDIAALPVEAVEPEAEADKIVSLEEADDIVSWALEHWMFMRDLELTPPPGKGYPGLVKVIQDRIVSTDGLENGVVGQFALYIVSHGRSLAIDGLDPKRHVDRGKLKLMRYIVVLSLPEPDALAIDGKLLGVHSRTVFRYAAGKDLVTKPVQSQRKPLALLSFLIHVPEEAL